MALNPDKKVSRHEYEVTITTTVLVSDRNILYDSSGNNIVDNNGENITTRHHA